MTRPSSRTRRLRGWRALRYRLVAGGWPAELARRLGHQQRLQVTHERIRLPGPYRMPPLRVAFATDFHAGPNTHPGLIARALATLRRLEPDLVLLGGDFVCQHARDIRRLAAGLATLTPPLGVFAVLGNHDHTTDPRYVARALGRAGVTLLTNRNHRLPAPWDRLWLCGLDDAVAGRPDPRAALAGAEGLRLLLTHAPAGLDRLVGERFELAVCGHTHGGQVALPGGVPLYLPAGHWSRRYAAGRFELPGSRVLVVSRGVGYSTLPFRAFCDPECHLLELTTDAHPGTVPAPRPEPRREQAHVA